MSAAHTCHLNGQLAILFEWALLRDDLRSALMEEAAAFLRESSAWTDTATPADQLVFMDRCLRVAEVGMDSSRAGLFVRMAQSIPARARELSWGVDS